MIRSVASLYRIRVAFVRRKLRFIKAFAEVLNLRDLFHTASIYFLRSIVVFELKVGAIPDRHIIRFGKLVCKIYHII